MLKVIFICPIHMKLQLNPNNGSTLDPPRSKTTVFISSSHLAALECSERNFFDELQGEVQVSPVECEESQGLDRSPCTMKSKGHKTLLVDDEGARFIEPAFEVYTC